MKKNHIVFMSGGKASFAVADYVLQTYPNDSIVLYFTDVLYEHESLYQFIYEASDKLKLPILIHSAGLNPLQLMFEKKVIYNSRIGDCSKLLKIKVSNEYLKKGIVPKIERWYNPQYLKQEDFITDATLYYGIDFMEAHRAEPIRKNWSGYYNVQFPLIDHFIDEEEVMSRHQIQTDLVLYRYGFSHNNCAARCVKAGISHYKNFAEKMPEEFKKHMEKEHYLKLYVSSYRYIKDIESDGRDGWDEELRQRLYDELDDAYRDYFYDRADKPKLRPHPCLTASVEYTECKQFRFVYNKLDGTVRRKPVQSYMKPYSDHMFMRQYSYMKKDKKPYPLTKFYQDLKNNKKMDNYSYGGCGCFTDYSSTSSCSLEKDAGQLTLAI